MPNHEGEFSWKAITEAIDPTTPKRDMAAKIAAAMIYHQLKLHGIENPLNPHRSDQLESAMALLTEAERQGLENSHHALPRHNYYLAKRKID